MEYDDVPLERSGAVKRFCDARADLQASQKLWIHHHGLRDRFCSPSDDNRFYPNTWMERTRNRQDEGSTS
jgi:hypothetical protein